MMSLIIQNLDILNTDSNDKNNTTIRRSTSMEVSSSQAEQLAQEHQVAQEHQGLKDKEEVSVNKGQDQEPQNGIVKEPKEEQQGAQSTTLGDDNIRKSMSASFQELQYDDDDDEGANDDNGEGAFILVRDNDSVSSLDSTDSFAVESLSDPEEAEDDEHRRRPRRRRGRRRLEEPQQRKPPQRQQQQLPNNGSHTPPAQRRTVRRSRLKASKVAAPIRSKTSPNLPRRQRTGEPAKRPLPPGSLQRNYSDPELMSPTRSGDDDDKMAQQRDSLESLKQSTHSLNHLELWDDDDDDGPLHHRDKTDVERWHDTAGTHDTSANLAMSFHSGDNSDATNSRWSASTGHRSMNTAQLDQLSTVPRFPRRQKTGENILQARQQVQQLQASRSQDSQDNNNNHNHKETTTTTTKKRPQLPNRQKSFRRNVLTMNQAAQAALAMAEHHLHHHGGNNNLSPHSQQGAPAMPRRSISGDTADTGRSFGRQKSLPNLRPHKEEYQEYAGGGAGTSDGKDPLSVSLHNETPRIPERKASCARPRRTSATTTTTKGGGSHSPYVIARASRIRRAKSDGARKVDISALLQDDDSNIASNLQSSWANHSTNSGNSFYFEPGEDDEPKMPRRTTSTEDLPDPKKSAAAVATANHEFSSSINLNAKIPERHPSNSTAWSTATARISLLGSSAEGTTESSRRRKTDDDKDEEAPSQRASNTSDLISLSMHSLTSLTPPSMPQRHVSGEYSHPSVRMGDMSMSLSRHSVASSTATDVPKMPRRQVSNDDENQIGPPLRRLGTIASAAGDAEADDDVPDDGCDKTEHEEDAGNLGDQEDGSEDDEEEEASMSKLAELPTARQVTDIPPPRALNLVNHNTSMSTLDESNNSHLYSSAPKLLKVARTSSATTATTATSTVSGNTKSSRQDAFIRLPMRQGSISERRELLERADAEDGARSNSKDLEMTILEEAEEGEPQSDGVDDGDVVEVKGTISESTADGLQKVAVDDSGKDLQSSADTKFSAAVGAAEDDKQHHVVVEAAASLGEASLSEASC